MIKNKKILAVVPARGGSKGVPLKNIRLVNGVPLVALSVPVIKALPEIDRAVLSSDHPDIIRIAKEAGLDAPFVRPPELSGDLISDWDVLVHALHEMEKQDKTVYDIVLLLPPTSPLRTPEQIRAVLETLVNDRRDSVWTVSETDLKFHPLKALVLDQGRMDYFDPRGSQIIARQQLTKTYFRNGVAYAFTKDCLLNQKKILGQNAGAVVIRDPFVNIDTLDDFDRLETILRQRGN